ncbi:hypothetical protein ACQP1W_43530 [Spirillospora sp. CA-255316]
MGRVLSGAGAALRQWRHPREFRIHASAWPADALTALTELARAEAARAEAAAAALDRADAPPGTAARPGTGATAGGSTTTGAGTGAGADSAPAADTVTDLPVPGPGPGGTAAEDDDTGPDGLTGRSLADVATSLWRLRARVDRMDDAPRAVVRHLETAWDALTDAGVEIKNHAGEPFDVGLAMSVVAYQPTPGLHREQIIETVRPGVYLGDRSIQMAEVIVGTPDPPPEAPAAGPTEDTRTT